MLSLIWQVLAAVKEARYEWPRALAISSDAKVYKQYTVRHTQAKAATANAMYKDPSDEMV